MKFLAAFVFILSAGFAFGVQFEVVGRDGWVARLHFNEPDKVKIPVCVIISDGKSVTNTEMIADVKEIREWTLGLPDGGYRAIILDGDKKVLYDGQFDLRIPFQAFLKETRSDSAEFCLEPGKSPAPVRWELFADGGKTPVRFGSVDEKSVNSVWIDRLESGTAYRADMISGNFTRSLYFKTGYRNAALNRPVSGNFTRLPASRYIDDTAPALSRVNDGRLEWQGGMAVSGEVDSGDQYVYIQLEKPAAVRSFRVYWHALHYPAAYYVLYGTDGKTWKSIRRESKDFRRMVAPDNSPVMVDEFEPTGDSTAAFAGLVVKMGETVMNRDRSKNYVELMEFEIYE